MKQRALRLWAVLCLVLLLQFATAQSFQVMRRQDAGMTSIATTKTASDGPKPTSPDDKDGNSKDEGKDDDKNDGQKDDKATKKGDATRSEEDHKAKKTSTAEPTGTSIAGEDGLDDSNFVNGTVSSHDPLPLLKLTSL